jgi:zinc protease
MANLSKLLLVNIFFSFMASTIYAQSTPLTNDPYKVSEFTLSNGLKVIFSPNRNTPRLQTMIAVKAGSKFDPAETTGLAHYLEHMMFKGTHKYGTLDWKDEQKVLAQISDLYEQHKNEKNEDKKNRIYAKIDSLSFLASKLAIPSEYDKMVASVGASGTNAFTSNDMTVYVNDIPNTAIEKWAKLEAERFSTLVLRLFHTELETVYEEFNRNQDDDIRWSNFAIDSMLMPNHPYGTQTTIGLGEHLKNPSMVNIHRYFNTYYVPNNIAIILSGDVNPATALPIIEKYFGAWAKREVTPFVKNPPVTITNIHETEVIGPTKEHVYIGFRFDGDNTKESSMAKMVDMLLANGAAGLLELNLVQKQKVLAATSYVSALKDYSVFKMYGEPKKGQTLEDVKRQLLAQLDSIKKGKFDDEMLKAIVTNLRLNQLQSVENNRSRAYSLMDAFVKDIPWKDRVNEIDEMAKVTKTDIVTFANKYFKDNYAVCYKRLGEPNRHKVDKPKITPVQLNKDSTSTFKTAFDLVGQGDIQARFLDFEKDMKRSALPNSGQFFYIKNEDAPLVSLNFIYNIGTDNNPLLGAAANYVGYLGTKKYTADQLKVMLYKLGVSYKLNVSRDRFVLSFSGLEENLPKALDLVFDALKSFEPDKKVYAAMIDDIAKQRTNAKLNKGVILTQAMLNYVKYGVDNPFKNSPSEATLRGLDPTQLIEAISNTLTMPDRITYYGQMAENDAFVLIKKKIEKLGYAAERPVAKSFPELSLSKPTVYFCNYNMKQAEVILLAKSSRFNRSWLPMINLYNDYYGSGLSSIMFQEVREKMALAYAVSSRMGVPENADESHYLVSYIGTQADKLPIALGKMQELLGTMVEVPKQFDGAKTAIVKNIESEWIKGIGVFNAYDRAERKAVNVDLRKEIYDVVKTKSMNDLRSFFDTNIAGRKPSYLVIGDKESIDFEVLKKLGEVKMLSLEEVFGY